MKQRRFPKKVRRFMVGSLIFALWFAYGYTHPLQAEASGQEVCNECHEEVVAKFQTSFHGKAWVGMGKSSGCQSCHGSANKHKEDPSSATIITFGKSSLQSASEQSQRCLACHSKATNLALWDMGKHQANDVSCTQCHSIHKPRNVVNQIETCTECHRSVRVQINKQSHHPIIEGKVSCSDCHNPHGSMEQAMLRADSRNQLCYNCHAEKRGPFIWEHPPVEENCGVCHEPHGSRHNKLMTEKVPNLCQNCHDWTRHPSTAYDNTDSFTQGSPNRTFIGRACLNCHPNIHGSNAGGTNGMRFTH